MPTLIERKGDIGEQFLNDLGIDTKDVCKVVIEFLPKDIPVAYVTRYVLTDKDIGKTVTEKYKLTKMEDQEEQKTDDDDNKLTKIGNLKDYLAKQ